MSKLAAFFKEADTAFGVFYPKHYLLAVFPSFEEADGAKEELLRAGRVDEDVIAVPGDEVVRFAEEHLFKDGLCGLLMTALSRSIGTEAAYADNDLAAAKKGAAFVAVHCPDKQVKAQMWSLLQPRRPAAARYYTSAGIEHLVGEI
jgi:hypothetical protein